MGLQGCTTPPGLRTSYYLKVVLCACWSEDSFWGWLSPPVWLWGRNTGLQASVFTHWARASLQPETKILKWCLFFFSKQLDKKGIVTPVPPRGRLSVPCTPARQQCPQDHSATKMNVRSSTATKDNKHKCSLTKTPARKSLHVTAPWSASKGQAMFMTPKLKTAGRNSTAVITPFKLTRK